MAISLVLLVVVGLRPGIEFTAGTTTLIRFDQPVTQAELRATYADLGRGEALIQSTGAREYLIRTGELEIPEGSFTEVAPTADADGGDLGPSPLREVGLVTLGADAESVGDVDLYYPADGDACTPGETAETLRAGTEVGVIELVTVCAPLVYRVLVDGVVANVAADQAHGFREPEVAPESPVSGGAGERTVIEQRLYDEYGHFEVLEFASVSAVVSGVAVRNAAAAVAVASLFIMAYVWFAFASVPRANRYAACAIAALIHDVVIVLGAFALFGILFGTEVNLMFVTGLLTVIGFSVHDTIVTFDRIRENVRSLPNAPLAENVNAALLQTMARSLNTSLTLLLTVVAMLFLGGVTIREFLLVILVGLVAGVYSSIGIAAQLLVAWEAGDFRRFIGRRAAAPSQSP
ncbi:MAG: hypothetical protein DWG80_04450 [Chloroflexi bacterium]|nr:hypothetical protein [Chloroflexota bacterium]